MEREEGEEREGEGEGKGEGEGDSPSRNAPEGKGSPRSSRLLRDGAGVGAEGAVKSDLKESQIPANNEEREPEEREVGAAVAS